MRWIVGILPFVAFAAAAACGGDASPPAEPTLTPAEAFAAADIGGIGRYWLGERLAGMRLAEASVRHTDDGSPSVTLEYVTTNNRDGECAVIELSPAAALPTEGVEGERERFDVSGGRALVHETPLKDVPLVQLAPATEPPSGPTATPRAPGSLWWADIELSDALVQISVACDYPPVNPWNSLAGMETLVRALVPFQRP